MTTQWKKWLSGVVGLALVLPIAGIAVSEDEADNNDRPSAERRLDESQEPNRDAQRESAAREDRAPRSVRRDRLESRDSVQTNVQDEADAPRNGNSPSDLPPRDLPPGPAPRAQHRSQGYVSPGGCCCGGGNVYSQNGNAYRSARVNNSGAYRSYSYQGGDEGAIVEAAPAPVYNNGYNGGYISGGRYGGVQNGANWDRTHEHDSRNFSGSYGSRASLRSGR